MLNADHRTSIAEGCRSASATAQQVRQGLERYVDELAAARINTFSKCLFSGYRVLFPSNVPGTQDLLRSEVVEQPMVNAVRMREFQARLRPLLEAGEDPVNVQLRRCHDHGIEFLACLRMNDRHPGGGPFKMEREELFLSDLKGFGEYRRGFDFTHPIVRDNLLAIAGEILHRYDVDGLELDWMRWCVVFPAAVARERAPLLSAFIGSVRALLDEAAQRRGRDRLTLSVRVPQSLQECRALGFDVEAWLGSGAVDCLCPSDFFYTDPNTRVEDFVALTHGTPCRVYPSVHPGIANGDDVGLMRPENYRAAALNFYRRGAAGVSGYNWQYHWAAMEAPHYPGPADMWPSALGFLGALRDPGRLDGPRHYLFHALWQTPSPAGFAHDDDIRLSRGEPEASGTFRFRVMEPQGTLIFKAVGLGPDEALSVAVNGKAVAPQAIVVVDCPQGQSKAQGHPWGAFRLHRLKLAAPLLVEGDNVLEAGLRTSSAGRGTVEIREVEFLSC